jgi:O-antigen ligase
LAIFAAAAIGRPSVFSPATRLMDAALLCSIVWIGLQLVPLPPSLRGVLSPHAGGIERAVFFTSGEPAARPLTVDAAATARALLVAAIALATFWLARDLAAGRGIRPLVRGIAWSGFTVAVVAMAVRTSSPEMLYGIWNAGEAARPYGPFVNRNHMGTWLVMALPLVVGYIFARAEDRAARGSVAAAIDTSMVWLIGAAAALLAAVVMSLSRSAFIGTLSAGLVAAALARRRRPEARVAVFVTGGIAAAILLWLPDTVDLFLRFEDSRTTATWARPQIWRETLPIVRDFIWTGTGAGSFRTGMLAYQQSDRAIFFNQAHNHYLHLAAEGGLLLIVPLGVAAVAFGIRAARRIAHERSPMFWIRTGAAAGIVGALVQSIWETGLRLPANALLFATLCGIAVHESRPAR